MSFRATMALNTSLGGISNTYFTQHGQIYKIPYYLPNIGR